MKNLCKSILLLLVVLSVSSCCDCKEKNTITTQDYKNQGHLISTTQAVKMHNNYKGFIKPQIEEAQINRLKNKNYQGTEYIWIDMQHLKNYISFLEAVEKKNQDQPKISGVAIYLGAYNANYSAQKVDEVSGKEKVIKRTGNYNGRETIFFNPTFITKGNRENNILSHKPFTIMPTNPEEDAFKGVYTVFSALEYGNEKDSPKLNQLVMSKSSKNEKTEGTSLADNELGTVPPM